MKMRVRDLTVVLLGVLFVALKLTEEITWPWLWVLSPFWLPIAFMFAWWALVGLLVLLPWLWDLVTMSKEDREREKKLRNARRALDAYAQTIAGGRR